MTPALNPMALKANYFKLGLFVIGAIVAGAIVLVVIGSGRWFQPKLTIETYFNESVQGLDLGSKLKYRGVAIGEVTKIGFTYNKYQLDRPMVERARYVLVEAQIEPRLLGGRAAAGDITNPKNAQAEIDRGLRVRLSPQGITGTSYLEIDYVDPPPPTLPIDWTARQHVHPRRAVDVHRAHQLRVGNHGPAAQARHRGDARQPEQAAGDDERPRRGGRHAGAVAAARPRAREDRDASSTASMRRSSPTRRSRCSPNCAIRTPSSRRRSPIRRCRSCPTTRRRRSRASARSSTIRTFRSR